MKRPPRDRTRSRHRERARDRRGKGSGGDTSRPSSTRGKGSGGDSSRPSWQRGKGSGGDSSRRSSTRGKGSGGGDPSRNNYDWSQAAPKAAPKAAREARLVPRPPSMPPPKALPLVPKAPSMPPPKARQLRRPPGMPAFMPPRPVGGAVNVEAVASDADDFEDVGSEHVDDFEDAGSEHCEGEEEELVDDTAVDEVDEVDEVVEDDFTADVVDEIVEADDTCAADSDDSLDSSFQFGPYKYGGQSKLLEDEPDIVKEPSIVDLLDVHAEFGATLPRFISEERFDELYKSLKTLHQVTIAREAFVSPSASSAEPRTRGQKFRGGSKKNKAKLRSALWQHGIKIRY